MKSWLSDTFDKFHCQPQESTDACDNCPILMTIGDIPVPERRQHTAVVVRHEGFDHAVQSSK